MNIPMDNHLTIKTPTQVFLEKSFYPKETTKKLLKLITFKAREEILNMHPLYLTEREAVEYLYLDKKNLTIPIRKKKSLTPLYKKFFTLDSEWFLKKCVEEISNQKNSLSKKDYSISSLKRFINEYLSIVEQFSDNKTHYAIKNLVMKTRKTKGGKEISYASSNFKVEKPISIGFYSFDAQKNIKIKVSPENLGIRVLSVNPKNILM